MIAQTLPFFQPQMPLTRPKMKLPADEAASPTKTEQHTREFLSCSFLRAGCAIRNGNEPDDRNNNIGFRCAKTPGFKSKKKRQTVLYRQAHFPGSRRLTGCRSVEQWVFIALVRRCPS